MLGGKGLKRSSQVALVNANYIAHRLKERYNIRFKNGQGRVAHELLIDLAEFEKSAGLKVTDFAKRLQVLAGLIMESSDTKFYQDYGFHPPTCSWPIPTCMLIEPTESESLDEIDRYIHVTLT
jgi:glycine dehydrogenase